MENNRNQGSISEFDYDCKTSFFIANPGTPYSSFEFENHIVAFEGGRGQSLTKVMFSGTNSNDKNHHYYRLFFFSEHTAASTLVHSKIIKAGGSKEAVKS